MLVGRRGADVSAKAPGDLKGKKVAIVEGYSVRRRDRQRRGRLGPHAREEDSLAQLLGGGVDYTLMDELVDHYIVNRYPAESGARLQIGTTPLAVRGCTWRSCGRTPMHRRSSIASTRSFPP